MKTKISALAALVVAALGATSAMAQSQPLTRDEVKADLARAMSSRSIEQNDLNYGTEWATSPSSQNYDRYIAGATAGSMSGSSMGAAADSTNSSMGAAGRSYDGSTNSGPASRADVAADRDTAMRSGRWLFNDLDGVQRLEPGWNSHEGRVFKGPADGSY